MTATTAVRAPDVPPSMRLYTVPEVMALLSLSRSAVYELMRTGRLESVRQGRARRIPGDAITAYIARLRQEAENTR